MATNTTKSVNEPMTEKDLTTQIKRAADIFGKETLVEVSVPKGLVNKIGPTLPLRINGVGLVLPVDGSKHKVPKSFAEHLSEYLNNLTV